jgi:thiamine biosynthesis lipoprotein
VTSGNYEKYVVIDSVKYGHIIDPKTGWPVKGIKSVTIVSPDAELSDALATSVFVLGVEKGLKLVNRLKNAECLIIDESNKILTSAKLNLNYY